VLVFSDLQSANVSYKLLSRLTDAEAIDPILLGWGRRCNFLQAGDYVEGIVVMAAVDVQSRNG